MAPSPQQSIGIGIGTNAYVEVVPLTLHIGAEIRGVDLSKPLPAEQLKEVRDAFLKWKVVFFRGQNLDHAQHVAMARQFGEPMIGHAVFGHVEGYPEVYSVAKNRTANENREQMMVTPPSELAYQDLIALTRAIADRRDTLGFGAPIRGPLVGLIEEEIADAIAALPAPEDGHPTRLYLGTDRGAIAVYRPPA